MCVMVSICHFRRCKTRLEWLEPVKASLLRDDDQDSRFAAGMGYVETSASFLVFDGFPCRDVTGTTCRPLPASQFREGERVFVV